MNQPKNERLQIIFHDNNFFLLAHLSTNQFSIFTKGCGFVVRIIFNVYMHSYVWFFPCRMIQIQFFRITSRPVPV